MDPLKPGEQTKGTSELTCGRGGTAGGRSLWAGAWEDEGGRRFETLSINTSLF